MAENKNVRPPMGGRRGGRVVEKPKDFKGTTKKLFADKSHTFSLILHVFLFLQFYLHLIL